MRHVAQLANGAYDEMHTHFAIYRCDNKHLRGRPLLDRYSTITRPLHDRYLGYTPSNTQAQDILAFWGTC
jgi:hypothetical protein